MCAHMSQLVELLSIASDHSQDGVRAEAIRNEAQDAKRIGMQQPKRVRVPIRQSMRYYGASVLFEEERLSPRHLRPVTIDCEPHVLGIPSTNIH